jgi:hypothetical protein
MPDLDLLGWLAFACIYWYLLWEMTRDWRVWIFAGLFPVLPPNLQTLFLACALLRAARELKEDRARQTEENKRTAGMFGPRPVP